MAGLSTRLRVIAVLGVAAWTVHQLRYALAFGSGHGEALQRSGHAYLQLAGPFVGLLLLLAASQLVLAIGRRTRAQPGAAPPSLARAWALLSVVLLAVFSAQELLEGALSTGHPAGADALLRDGGWLALPLAAAAGLVVALVLREADAAVAAAPPVRLHGVLRWACAPAVLAATPVRLAVAAGPARHLAGRGPPAV